MQAASLGLDAINLSAMAGSHEIDFRAMLYTIDCTVKRNDAERPAAET